MTILFFVFAIGLAFAAYKANDRSVRAFCIVFCLANLIGAGTAIYKNDLHAFKLRPNDGEYDPIYRPARR